MRLRYRLKEHRLTTCSLVSFAPCREACGGLIWTRVRQLRHVSSLPPPGYPNIAWRCILMELLPTARAFSYR